MSVCPRSFSFSSSSPFLSPFPSFHMESRMVCGFCVAAFASRRRRDVRFLFRAFHERAPEAAKWPTQEKYTQDTFGDLQRVRLTS